MPRLKNRNEGIPGGVQFVQPEIGWDASKIPNLRGRSFNVVRDAIVALRVGNPFLAKKHNWATDVESVGNELDEYNALRMQNNPRWHHFITDAASGGSFPKVWPRPSVLGNAVAGVRKIAAGVRVLVRWLGDSGRPVEKTVAEARAVTCVRCPKNTQGDWKDFFTEEVAREVLLVFGIMNDMRLNTSHDEKLGTCRGCLCPLKSKVWTPLPHILKELKPEIKAALNQENPVCWIIAEQG